MEKNKIVFFGEDSFSLIVLESLVSNGFVILKTYTNYYNNNIHRRLEIYCNELKIQFLRVADIHNTELIKEIELFDIDFIVVCHFKKILPKKIFSAARYGALNLHPSLLPKYRGMSPQHWPIIKGDKITGITVHYIEETVDTGNIIMQREVEISKNDYVFDLQQKFKHVYKDIVLHSIIDIIKGNVKPKKQNNNCNSYYGKLKVNDCIIDRDSTVECAYNLIRGVSKPYFGARYSNLIIWKAEIIKDNNLTKNSIGYYDDEIYGPIIVFKDGYLKLNKYEITNN